MQGPFWRSFLVKRARQDRRLDANAILTRISLWKNQFRAPEEVPDNDFEYDEVHHTVPGAAPEYYTEMTPVEPPPAEQHSPSIFAPVTNLIDSIESSIFPHGGSDSDSDSDSDCESDTDSDSDCNGAAQVLTSLLRSVTVAVCLAVLLIST